MLHAKMLLRAALSSGQQKRRRREHKRPESLPRGLRYSKAMRPPAGVVLAYRRALRAVVGRVSVALEREVFPLLEATLPAPAPLDAPRFDAEDDGARTEVRSRLAAIRDRLLGIDHSATVQEIGARVATANAGEFRRILKIDVRAVSPGVATQVDEFRKANVELIKSIPEQLLDDVSRVVDEGWSRGTRVEVLRKELQQRFDVSKSRADLIARDQVLKLNSQITKTRQTNSGIVEYVWTTSHDERVRGNPDGKYPDSDRDHYSLDGKRFRWDQPPVVNSKTGETAHPGEDFQCRCVAVPVVPFLDDSDD